MISPLTGLSLSFLAFLIPILLRSRLWGLLCLALASAAFLVALPGEIYLSWWLPPFGIYVRADQAALYFAALASILCFLTGLWTWQYQEPRQKVFYAWLGLFCYGAVGAILAGDPLNFFFHWELTTLSLYLLIRPNEPDVAFRYLVVQLAGASLVFAGLLATQGPRLDLASGWGAVVLALGLGTKAALWGLHFWLPDAHTKAPAPVSALLSGMAVKLGIYGLMRLVPLGEGLLWLGILAALWGGIFALFQHDAKTILAYSTLSQLGYILVGLAAPNPLGHQGALYHILGHAFFKALLFLTVGAVGYRLGTRDLRRMGGISRLMPLTTAAATVAALAAAGVAPLAGFPGKQLIKEAMYGAGVIPLALATADLLTVLYLARLLWFGFYRPAERGMVPQAPLSMRAAQGSLALLCLLGGFAPDRLWELVPAMPSLLTDDRISYGYIVLATGFFLFTLGRRWLAPGELALSDVAWFYRLFGKAPGKIHSLFLQAHNGDLQRYLTWFFAYLVLLIFTSLFL
jgi:multicomponent Na+:H+ antiporter subunit D